MRLFAPDRSRAVLIGTSRYTADPELSALPAVRNNLDALRTVLTDRRYCGFPRDRCTVITDPDDSQAIGRALAEAGEDAEDLLLVYYAGHGLIDRQGELYLGLQGTSSHTSLLPYSGVPYGLIRRSVRASKAASRVVILDCCFSGRAIDAAAGPEAVVAGQVEIQGVYTLTSSSRTSTSIAAEGRQFTAFTGELLRILVDGVPGGPEFLTLDLIYEELHRGLARAGLPEPHVGREQNIHRLGIARNTAVSLESRPEPPVVQAGRRGARHVRRRTRVRVLSLTVGAAAVVGVTGIALTPTLMSDRSSHSPHAVSGAHSPIPAPSGTSSSSHTPTGSPGVSPASGTTTSGTTPSGGSSPAGGPTVPSKLLGASLGGVVDRLNSLKILYDVQYEKSQDRNQVVVRVEPQEGTGLEKNQHVQLYVARQYKHVPDLVGLTRDEVQIWASQNGMNIRTEVIQDSVCIHSACDTAVSQDKTACSEVFVDETVVVTLGTRSRVPHARTPCP